MIFSVGIPRLNENELFTETLHAIERSSVRPARVIVIDNGDAPWIRATDEIDRGLVRDIVFVRPISNMGVAASWNRMLAMSPCPMILLNADCAVAPSTFERMLSHPRPAIVCAYGFSCFRIDPEIIASIGTFDEGFFPGYWEDTDYRRRCDLAGVPIIDWETYPRTVVDLGRERSVHGIVHGKHDPDGYQGWRGVKLTWLHTCIEKNRERYIAKWGGGPGSEAFAVPFNGAPDPGRATQDGAP